MLSVTRAYISGRLAVAARFAVVWRPCCHAVLSNNRIGSVEIALMSALIQQSERRPPI